MSPSWRRWLGAVLATAALAFLGRTIAAEWAELRTYDWSVRYSTLGLSVIALILVFAFGVWIWARTLARLHGRPVAYPDLLRIWFLSSLARYVPGKIWQLVGAAQMAHTVQVTGPVLLTSMLVYMGFTLLGAAVVSLALLLPAGITLDTRTAALIVTLAGASTLLVHPRVLNFALGLVPKALHAEVIRWTGGWRDGLLLLGLAVVSWIAYGLAFSLFVASMVDVPNGAFLPLIGANALAFLVGYLVFVAPAGLGAREAALALLLGPYAPAGIAALIAVAARLWTIAAEVVGAALIVALHTTGTRTRPAGRS